MRKPKSRSYKTIYAAKPPYVGRAMIGKSIVNGELINFKVDRVVNIALTPDGIIATSYNGDEYQYRPITEAPPRFKMKRIK